MPSDNFSFVTPFLARGAQPDKAGFESLRAGGFEVVLKLNHDDEVMSTAQEAKAFEGTVWHYDKLLTLRPNTVDLVIALAEQMHQVVQSDRKLFVHCTYGRDRTGLAIAAYEVWCLGVDVNIALQHRRDHGSRDLFDQYTMQGEKLIRQLADGRLLKKAA